LDKKSDDGDDGSNNGRQSYSSSTTVNVNVVGGTNVSTPKMSNQCPHKIVVSITALLPPPFPPSPPVVTEQSSSTTNPVSMSVDRPPPIAFVAAFVLQLYCHNQEQHEQKHQLPIQMLI